MESKDLDIFRTSSSTDGQVVLLLLLSKLWWTTIKICLRRGDDESSLRCQQLHQNIGYTGKQVNVKEYNLSLLCIRCKCSEREYRAIASWRHLIHFELRAKVCSVKGIIQLKIWSEHGLRQRTHFRAKLYLRVCMFTKNHIDPYFL